MGPAHNLSGMSWVGLCIIALLHNWSIMKVVQYSMGLVHDCTQWVLHASNIHFCAQDTKIESTLHNHHVCVAAAPCTISSAVPMAEFAVPAVPRRIKGALMV